MGSHRVSLDSCAVIHMLAGGTYAAALKPLADHIVTNQVEVVISEVCIAECRRLNFSSGRQVDHATSRGMIDKFFDRRAIMRRPVTDRVSKLAGELIDQHGIGTCDALVAATAALNGTAILYTTDGCSGRRKDGKLMSVDQVVLPNGHAMLVRCPVADEYTAAWDAHRLTQPPDAA